jgi:hypothetical protein
VDHSVPVGVLQSVGNASCYPEQFAPRQCSRANEFREIAIGNDFRDHENLSTRCDSNIINGKDVRVIQAGDRTCLVEEFLPHLPVGKRILGNLVGNVSFQLPVECSVDDGKAT